MARSLTITNSALGTFRTCQRKYGYGYVLGIAPKRVGSTLRVGAIVHDGLAAWYRALAAEHRASKDAPLLSADSASMTARCATQAHLATLESLQRRSDEEDARSADSDVDILAVRHEALGAVDRFCEFIGPHDVACVPVLVEEPFDVVVHARDGARDGGRGLRFAGVIDAVLYDPRCNALVIYEHKTSIDVDRVLRKLDMDPQVEGYLYALRELQRTDKRLVKYRDANIGLVRYTVLSRKGPREPAVLTDGVMISAAAIETTRSIYETALMRQAGSGRPISDAQRRRAESLPTSMDRWVRRAERYVSESEIQRWVDELLADSLTIRASARREPGALSRNPEACNAPWSPPCAFRALCVSNGASEVRQALYRQKTSAHEEVEQARDEIAASEQSPW